MHMYPGESEEQAKTRHTRETAFLNKTDEDINKDVHKHKFPKHLYHLTEGSNVESIKQHGLKANQPRVSYITDIPKEHIHSVVPLHKFYEHKRKLESENSQHAEELNEQYSETDHETVLKKHGFDHTEGGVYKHKDLQASVHLGKSDGSKARFWSIQHGNNPAGNFDGVTGLHSARHLDKALRTYKSSLKDTQHAEELPSVKKRLQGTHKAIRTHTYLEHLKAGGKPNEGGVAY